MHQRQLAPDLTSDEMAIVNEITRRALILSSGLDPERRVILIAQVAAQMLGVTMAVESAPRRNIDSERVFDKAADHYREGASRAYIHALADIVAKSKRAVGDILLDWQSKAPTARISGQDSK